MIDSDNKRTSSAESITVFYEDPKKLFVVSLEEPSISEIIHDIEFQFGYTCNWVIDPSYQMISINIELDDNEGNAKALSDEITIQIKDLLIDRAIQKQIVFTA